MGCGVVAKSENTFTKLHYSWGSFRFNSPVDVIMCHDSIITDLTHCPLEDFNGFCISNFKPIFGTDGQCISCDIAFVWLWLKLTDHWSVLVQVMAWCRQTTSHYWANVDPEPYCVTRPQWVIIPCIKPSPEPILTSHQSCTVAFTCGRFTRSA